MMSEKGNERSGFFEADEFDALLEELPDYLRGPIRVAYLTGWRKSEILSRRKNDLNDQFLTLDAKDSKNGEGRKFPLTPELRQVLEEQAAWVRRLAVQTGRIIEWLFPNPEGNEIGDFRKAWDSAVKRAGLGQKFFHDFRRTATRNMERKRLTHLETMALVGHKTLSMHKRYNFKDDARLLEIGAQIAAADEAVQPASNIASIGGGSVAGGAKKVSKIND
jgi:integrase